MKLAGLLLTLAACGDNSLRELELEPTSGSRLRLVWALYDDGSRQLDPGAFYDARLHARCTPRTWIDGAVRCVPDADDAVFRDAGCTEAVGRARTIEKPTHFLHYELRDGVWLPDRVFRAGLEPVELALYWQQRGGACNGPYVAQRPRQSDQTYFEIDGELGGEELVAFEETQLGPDAGDERLVLRMRTSEDGVRAPLGFYDRDLGVPCAPSSEGDRVACEPLTSTDATLYSDLDCRERAVVGPAQIARVIEPSGCATYHAVGVELGPLLYRLDGDRCTRTILPEGERAFAVGAALELGTVERVVEPGRGARLERVLLVQGELRFAHDRLYDTATRADCQAVASEDGLRCIPVARVPAKTLYASGCAFELRFAELPERSCDRPAFALATPNEAIGDATIDVHAIGDAFEGDAFEQTGAGCVRYTPPDGTSLRELGPPLALDTFVRGYTVGER